jgi:hypothetical protein
LRRDESYNIESVEVAPGVVLDHKGPEDLDLSALQFEAVKVIGLPGPAVLGRACRSAALRPRTHGVQIAATNDPVDR